MIFLHIILGLVLGKLFGDYTFFILGSLFPDIDHIYVILKNKLFSIKKLILTVRYEEKYGLNYKTPLVHSFFGLILSTGIVYFLFGTSASRNFGLAYFFHFLLDWPDIDIKYYLFPLKIKFKGFLPIWSRFEQIVTCFAILLLVILFIIFW